MGFNDTQNVTSHTRLPQKLLEDFGIDWLEVEWIDLLKPLYSGLAARLTSIVQFPPESDIRGQGQY